jgi:DNA-binding XRE family transcriptional regulator
VPSIPWKEVVAQRPETPEFRAAYEASRRETIAEIVAYHLDEIRTLRNLTQTDLARQLGISQAAVSGIEKADCKISTLRKYIEGLGGHLELSAVFDDVKVSLAPLLPDE